MQDIRPLFHTEDPTGPALGMFLERLENEILDFYADTEKLQERKDGKPPDNSKQEAHGGSDTSSTSASQECRSLQGPPTTMKSPK